MKFYTIGYGGKAPNDFLSLLNQRGIVTLVDVRLKPRASFNGKYYTKTRDAAKGIQGFLASAGISYISLPELGNPYKDFDNWQELYEDWFKWAGTNLIRQLLKVKAPACLMCGCKRAVTCHRLIISGYLESLGYEVEHIE